MKIISVVGARPNFMKVAPLHKAFKEYEKIESKIVHTGQHYDAKMSDIFFNQLELPKPDYYLGISGGSHTVVTAKIMMEFEQIVQAENPDLILVVGDVNSTVACAMVASKMNIKLAHVEAGLRSEDRAMPEEINRIITDNISDMLFVTEQSGMINLAKEGIADDKIFFVGNVMIDSLCHYQSKSAQISMLKDLEIPAKEYILMTMHRPTNVDNQKSLEDIIEIIKGATAQQTIIFPIHPRTAKNIDRFGLKDKLASIPNLILLEPLGYLEFLHLMTNARLIITDSGGIQEESTFLQVPCLTFRDSTERPITVDLGTNILLPELSVSKTLQSMQDVLDGKKKKGIIPPLWDGNTSHRIAQSILQYFAGNEI